MGNYTENKIRHKEISFLLTDSFSIDEREIHSYHEILLFCEGEAQLLTKNGQYEIKSRSVIVVPAGTYHFFRFKNKKSFKRIKISFPVHFSEHKSLECVMSKLKVFENLNNNIDSIFSRLCFILNEKAQPADIYAYSAFLMLISELDMSYDDDSNNNYSEKNGVMTKIMEYISKNLSGDLSVNFLSKKFSISSSGITHLFKKEFGISLHRYILQERMVFAKRLISKGENPSEIYSLIGFLDYSSFYKAYMRLFGYSPSKEKEKARCNKT